MKENSSKKREAEAARVTRHSGQDLSKSHGDQRDVVVGPTDDQVSLAVSEEALRASELSYRRLFEAAKDGS